MGARPLEELIPARRGVAKTEAVSDVGIDPSFLEITARSFTVAPLPERLFIKALSQREHAIERLKLGD
jgi:hypothetical protein